MADPDFYVCDVCGEKVDKRHRLRLATAETDSDDCTCRDLCTTHLVESLQIYLKLKDHELPGHARARSYSFHLATNSVIAKKRSASDLR